MRNIFFILFLSFGNLHSQTTFFIRPVIEKKAYVGTTDNTLSDFLLFNNQTALNPYFQVKNQLISVRSILYIGLNFGVSIANKHSFEFGWSQDGAGSSWRTMLMSWDTTNIGQQRYSDNKSIAQSHIHYQRFGLSYQYSFNNSKEKTNYGILAGVGILFNSNKKKNTAPESVTYGSYASPESTTYLDENISIPIQENEMFASARFSGFLSLGFFTDIRVNNKYLFSASMSYLQGFKYMEYSIHRYLVVDNGTEKRFVYTSASKGSGFYFQISRKFQIYPWKQRKKSS